MYYYYPIIILLGLVLSLYLNRFLLVIELIYIIDITWALTIIIKGWCIFTTKEYKEQLAQLKKERECYLDFDFDQYALGYTDALIHEIETILMKRKKGDNHDTT